MRSKSGSTTIALLLGMCLLSSASLPALGLDLLVSDPAASWFQKQSSILLGEDPNDHIPPQISGLRVFPSVMKRGDPRAEISARIKDPSGYCLAYAEVGNRLILMLDLDGDQVYTGYCNSNLPPGSYNITVVALDKAGNAARRSGLAIRMLDPSDLNANGIEDSLEKLGPEEERVIVLHEGNLSAKDQPWTQKNKFKLLPASSVVVPGNLIPDLAKMKGVKGVYKDQKLKVLVAPEKSQEKESLPFQSSPYLAGYQGVTGRGITVALVDTGVDPAHVSLDDMDDDPSTYDPKIVGFKDFVNGLEQPYDDNGHGTHCASLISGTRGIGVAPGTKLVVAKVMDKDGACYLSDAITALDWLLENKDRYGINIISFSVGGESPSEGTSLLDQACDRMVEEGLVVCVAAGNSGPGPGSIVVPGSAEKVITVGAIDSQGRIFSRSSRGPTPDGRTKPDLVALGVDVISALVGSGDGTSPMSGTSMAVPQVSGAAALLIEADPKLYPWDVKRILLKSTDDLGETGPDNVFGYGALNIENALDRLQSPEGLKNPTLGRLSLSKAEASVGDPVIIEAGASGDVEGLIAHILGPDKEMEIPMIDFDSNSVYTAWWDTSYWAPGEYTVEVELKGTFGETELSSASFLLKP